MSNIIISKRTLAVIIIVIVAASTTGISAYALTSTAQSSQQNYLLSLFFLQTGQPRIVSGAPDIDEILYGLGLGNDIVGCTVQSDYPPALMTRISLGQVSNQLNWWYPSEDVILSLNPTVTFLDQGSSAETSIYDNLISQGKQAYLVLEGNSIEQIETAIYQVASVFGKGSAAQTLVNAMQTKISNTETAIANATEYANFTTPNVLMIVYWWTTGLYTCGNQTFESEMIQDAGGLNIYYNSTTNAWPNPNTPDVITQGQSVGDGNIDYIVYTANGVSYDPATVYSQMSTTSLITTSAWKNGNIYFCLAGQADDLLTRAGPRVAEGVQLLSNMFLGNIPYYLGQPYHVIDNDTYVNYCSPLIPMG